MVEGSIRRLRRKKRARKRGPYKSLFFVLLILPATIGGLPAPPAAAGPHLVKERKWGLLMGFGFQGASWAHSVPEEVKVTAFYPSLTVAGFSRARWHLDLELEGIFAYRTNEQKGIIVGLSPMVRLLHETSPLIHPYLEVGAGGTYTDMDLQGMGSRANFSLQGGAGIEIEIGRGDALRVEYRLLHLSNAGLARQNRALNANLILFGLRHSF